MKAPINIYCAHLIERRLAGWRLAVGQTFTFVGAGNAFNGIAKRMELWIDGKKVAQNLEDQPNATVSLSKGSHTASFVVVDSFDEYTARSVKFTSSY